MSADEQLHAESPPLPPPLPPPAASPRKSGSLIKRIVIIVCGVVAAVAAMLVALGIILCGISGNRGYTKVDVAKLLVNSYIEIPLQAYRMDMGDYPSTAEGLQALVTAPLPLPAAPSPLPAVFRDSADKAGRWRGPYVVGEESKIFTDPWGNPYQYRYPGIHNKNKPDVWSKGPDGQDGTADDIGNWPKEGAATSGITGF